MPGELETLQHREFMSYSSQNVQYALKLFPSNKLQPWLLYISMLTRHSHNYILNCEYFYLMCQGFCFQTNLEWWNLPVFRYSIEKCFSLDLGFADWFIILLEHLPCCRRCKFKPLNWETLLITCTLSCPADNLALCIYSCQSSWLVRSCRCLMWKFKLAWFTKSLLNSTSQPWTSVQPLGCLVHPKAHFFKRCFAVAVLYNRCMAKYQPQHHDGVNS